VTHMSREAREKLIGIDPETFAASLAPEDRDLFLRADLGVEIEAWLETNPIGKFFANMLEIERADAVEALVRAMTDKPADTVLHQKHHQRVARCDQYKGWLLDAIQVGREAQAELKAREQTD
jgi:hypothetical protein